MNIFKLIKTDKKEDVNMNKEVAYCVKCKVKKEYASEPVYKTFGTTRGLKAMLMGVDEHGHKLSKLCKVKSSEVNVLE